MENLSYGKVKIVDEPQTQITAMENIITRLEMQSSKLEELHQNIYMKVDKIKSFQEPSTQGSDDKMVKASPTVSLPLNDFTVVMNQRLNKIEDIITGLDRIKNHLTTII